MSKQERKAEYLEGNIINKASNQFIQCAYNKAKNGQKEQVKEIFFAGALFYHSTILRLSGDEYDDEELDKIMNQLEQEFNYFESNLADRAKT